MKKIVAACLLMVCGSIHALSAKTTAGIDSLPVAADSIVSIRNLSSNLDTAKIKEIIAVKLNTNKPLSDFTTLYLDGIKVGGSKPWKVSEFDKTVYFQLGDSVDHLVQQFLKDKTARKNIVPVYISVGSTGFASRPSADPLYLEINQKINPIWVMILAAVLFVLVIVALVYNVLKDDNNLYYSLGRTQLFFWTVLFAVCYLYVCYCTGMLPDIPASVLAILGISAGTTAVTKIIENESKKGVPIHKTAKSEGWFLDILSDGSSINIHRFQNVIFNLLFGIIFVQRAFALNVIPVFDSNVLLLLGLSSGTYAGLKMTEATKVQNEESPQVVSDAVESAGEATAGT